MTLKPTSSQGSGGGGSGTVTQVSSADTSIAVATGTTTPVLTVAALNTIAANHATSGSVAMNSNKLTGLAAGSGSGDSLRYEQVIGSNVLAVSNLAAGTAGQVLQGTGPTYALPPGYEIGYDQITSTVDVARSTEATPTTIITCGAHTFDGTAVMLEVYCYLTTGTAANVVQICLFESTTEISRLGAVSALATGIEILPVKIGFRFTPTAASHTYLITAFANSTSGTKANVGGGSGSGANAPPAYARFTKV